jgi:hypothetical protein
LAHFNPIENLSCYRDNPSDKVWLRCLIYELEPNNLYDKNAVKVYKDGLYLGHIKLIHNKVFIKQVNGLV